MQVCVIAITYKGDLNHKGGPGHKGECDTVGPLQSDQTVGFVP